MSTADYLESVIHSQAHSTIEREIFKTEHHQNKALWNSVGCDSPVTQLDEKWTHTMMKIAMYCLNIKLPLAT